MKAVCLLSGGMDSSTLAYVARDMGYAVYALHMTYGQRTENRERECAKKVAQLLGAREFLGINLDYFARIGGSSLTDRSMEITDHEEGQEGIPSTYVPFRNANLLSIATSYAEARGADAIFIGVQTSDYAGYPDCRPEFIDAFQRVIDLGTADETHIRLVTPFVRLKKADILRTGIDLGVPYEHTWSCYRSEGPACGRCDSCHYRLEAFRQVGARDPIAYAEER
ncbi:MAG: 7-cyano-7-deazaguanine synthase QueC [Methanomicrobiaceae archaeon]|nr:7-cyano-7-deazaguanine synthase QueC [Methanomicrobiaceae archaeon]